jgi:hypothetical protein
MGFDINSILGDMAGAIKNVVKQDAGDIKQYANQTLEKEKDSLEKLGLARLAGEIDDEIFTREIEREKKVVEVDLLTIQIMTKVLAQKAANAAIDVFAKAVKTAIDAAL